MNEASAKPIIEVDCHNMWLISPANEQGRVKEKQELFQIRNKEKKGGSYLGFETPSGRGSAMYG